MQNSLSQRPIPSIHPSIQRERLALSVFRSARLQFPPPLHLNSRHCALVHLCTWQPPPPPPQWDDEANGTYTLPVCTPPPRVQF